MKGFKKMAIVIILVLLILVAIFTTIDGSFAKKQYAQVWSERYTEQLNDAQLKIIANAIKAQSSHNMQPWLVKLDQNNTIKLYADMNKALEIVDSGNEQMLISLGCFIQTCEKSANYYGFRVGIEYFEPDLATEIPLVAELSLVEDSAVLQPDSLAGSSVLLNKESTDVSLITEVDRLVDQYQNITYEIIEGDQLVEFQEYLLEGTVIESTNQLAMDELLSVFRWTENDKNKYRYGMSLTTLPPLIKPIVQPIMKLISKKWVLFGQQSIEMFKDRLSQEKSYILLKCTNPDYSDYLDIGRVYQAMHYTLNNYYLRPNHQALEKYDDMKELNKRFQMKYGKEGQVMIIIGVRDKSELTLTPRHIVEDIIID